ncbi:MAG: O-acetylhomoserine aminocarboxypropyltransferase/cysteine synthase [Candidatus Gastranaerophilales bacterium]|nr:O-acetylhomoserine aminocarboxypropyltransferase/cysteine synthase [Candidatus Gastranaerophilales bacterium]
MNFDTKAVHNNQDYKGQKHSISTPIYPTTAYSFDNVEHASNLYGLVEEGDIYTRISNPTTNILEKTIAELEGGVGALAVSSGQAAISLAVLNIVKAGDEIVATKTLYGGTYNLFAVTLPKYGIKTNFVTPMDFEELENAINEKTKCVYVETIGNPGLNMVDIEKYAQIAHKNKLPLIIDNTVATPYLCRPIEFGADIVVHSTTKYLGGHGSVVGGVIVDSGNFDWKNAGKFDELTTPDKSYQGIIYTEKFGKAAYIAKVRAQMLRDFGPCQSPFNSFLTLQGIQTLHLRMQRHSQNAMKVAKFLENHPLINWVTYPGLESYENYELVKKYLPNGQSSLVSFGVKGEIKNGIKFIESCKLLVHTANLGDVRSIITYPAATTHKQLSEADLIKAGITKDFMRLSVGIEDVNDIIEDIDKALKESQKL